MATGTTPNGTAWTSYSAGVGGTTVWCVANVHAADTAIPTVLYCHGAGGSYNQFLTLGAWADLRNWLIDNGWAFIEGTGGGSQPWGNQASQDAYNAAFAHVDGILDIGPVVVLGRSMGGAVGARLYIDHRTTDARFVGFIANSGVQDLVWAYDYDSWTAAMNSAWGVTDRAGFVAAVAGLNPIDGPASDWAGANVLQMWGSSDTTVTPADNAIAMRNMYAGQPATDIYDIRAGGDHSATNGSYLQVAAMTAFLADLGGAGEPPPTVGSYLRVMGAYVTDGTNRYALTIPPL